MASSFTIQAKGFDKLAQVLKDLPRRVQQEVKNEFVAVGQEWTREAKRDAPSNVGRLRASVISSAESGLVVKVAAQTDYAAYMEFGTKSKAKVPAAVSGYATQFQGKGSGGTNPLVALQQWVKRKGLAKRGKNSDKAQKQIAYLIWRKIKRFGVNPQPFLFSSKGKPGAGDRLKKFDEMIRKNVSDVLQRLLNA